MNIVHYLEAALLQHPTSDSLSRQRSWWKWLNQPLYGNKKSLVTRVGKPVNNR